VMKILSEIAPDLSSDKSPVSFRTGTAGFALGSPLDSTKGEPPPPSRVTVAGLLCFPHLLSCLDLLRICV